MLLVRHDGKWLTAADLTDISSWSVATEVVCPALDQAVQMASGLRAEYQLAIARLNRPCVTSFKVHRTYATAWAATVAAHTAAATFSAEGLAEFFVYDYTPTLYAEWTQSDAALRVRPVHNGGVLVTYEFEISGGAPTIVSDLTGGTVGYNNITPTFIFPDQLSAGQIGGAVRMNKAGYISQLDLTIGELADAEITGELIDGNNTAIGINFALAAGQRVASLTPDEVLVQSGRYIIPRLLTVGTSAAPGQNLHFILTLRQ